MPTISEQNIQFLGSLAANHLVERLAQDAASAVITEKTIQVDRQEFEVVMTDVFKRIARAAVGMTE